MYDWREAAAGGKPAADVKKTIAHTDILPDSKAKTSNEPDTGMAARFLSMLDPKAQKFTFQVFHDKSKKLPAEVINGSLAETQQRLIAYNKMGYGVFVTVNKTDGTGRKRENVIRPRAVWQEIDLPNGIPLAQGSAYREQFNSVINPSIEVESSPGNRHNYFLCNDLSMKDFEGCQPRIVESHGSDSNAADLCRVLRVPGFFHCKDEPFMVRLLGGPGTRYSRDEILAAFPPIARSESSVAIKGDMPYSPAAESLLRSWIRFIPGQKAAERHNWISQGIVFARLGDDWGEASGRGDVRLELWEALSRKCEGYEAEGTGCAEKWNDILQSASRPCENPATFRSFLYAARGAAWTLESSGIDPALIDDARAALDAAQGRPERASPEECFESVAIDDDWRGKQAALAPEGASRCAQAHATAATFNMSFDNQDFVTLPPPREWLYGRHFIRKFVSMTVAPGGVGKSSLTLAEAIAMASGRDLLKNGFHKRWKVAVWNGEDPKDELRRRVIAIIRHFEITPEELQGRFTIASGHKHPLCLMKQIEGTTIASPDVGRVKAFLKASGVDVFIVDPFVQSHGVPENDNGAIDRVVKQWAAIANECNCSIELVHHPRKPASGSANETSVDDARGAGALLAGTRSARVLNVMTPAQAKRLQVEPEERRRYFRVDNGKANMQPPATSADWYVLKSQALGNATNGYIEDFVGVATAWKPPAEKSIFDILAAELASIDAWNCPHQVTAIIVKLTPDERKLFGSITHRSRTIADKLEAEGIDVRIETEFGLLVFDDRGRGVNGGFWVELRDPPNADSNSP